MRSKESCLSRLEAGADLLRAADLGTQSLLKLSKSRRWAQLIRRNAALLDFLAESEAEIAPLLARAAARGEVEGWPAPERRWLSILKTRREALRVQAANLGRAELATARLETALQALEKRAFEPSRRYHPQPAALVSEILPVDLRDLRMGHGVARAIRRFAERRAAGTFDEAEWASLRKVLPTARACTERLWARLARLDATGMARAHARKRAAREAVSRPGEGEPETSADLFFHLVFWTDQAESWVEAVSKSALPER